MCDPYREMVGTVPGEVKRNKRKGHFVEELVVHLLIDVVVAVVGILFGRLLNKLGILPA
jgi:hypothetical protein